MQFQIKVTGPGGIVNVPTEIVHAAFELLGFNVEVENQFSGSDGRDFYVDVEECKKMLLGQIPIDKKYLGIKNVVVKADHRPWGG